MGVALLLVIPAETETALWDSQAPAQIEMCVDRWVHRKRIGPTTTLAVVDPVALAVTRQVLAATSAARGVVVNARTFDMVVSGLAIALFGPRVR